MKKILIAISLLTIVFTACKKKPITSSNVTEITDVEEIKDEAEKVVLITFHKSACYGTCPYYEADILADGSISFNGRAHTPITGEHTLKAPEGFIDEIYKRANDMNFFELEDKYDNQYVTDIPSTTLRIQTNSRYKQVIARWESPQDLNDLNEYINQEILKLCEDKKNKKTKKIKVLDDRYQVKEQNIK